MGERMNVQWSVSRAITYDFNFDRSHLLLSPSSFIFYFIFFFPFDELKREKNGEEGEEGRA